MDGYILGAIMLVIGLLIWAALGHLIWVLCSKIVVWLMGTQCPHCGRISLQEGACRDCVSRLASRPCGPPSVKDDLSAAKRLLQFSRFNQWLTDEQHDSLASQLERLAVRLASAPEATLVSAKPAETAPQVVGQAAAASERLERALQPSLSESQSTIVEATLVEPFEEAEDIFDSFQGTSTTTISQIHPLDAPDEPTIVQQRRQPAAQRLTADLLQSFMEQSNIRWIELISASLIVVCSVGLVISLWNTLSNTSRFFPSLVFLLATAAVHGAGQYTLRKWKLRSTSRGILQIALMLIPLAMLVGILLARRDGPLLLDAMTVGAIVSGIFVYGCLAITASRALFSRRWGVVAAVSMASSISLLPIYYAAQGMWLTTTTAALILLPMLLASMWAALTTSLSTLHRIKFTEGQAKSVAGIVAQCCFAAGVVSVFWIVASRGSGNGLSSGWWLSLGLLSATWASWGWATSLAPWQRSSILASTREALPRFTNASWLRIVAWCLACVCTALLLAALWQTSTNRWAVSGLLGCIASWWMVHGWICRVPIGFMLGGLAAILSFTLGSEVFYAHSVENEFVHWVGLARIATLTGSGLAMLGGGLGLMYGLTPFRQKSNEPRQHPPARARRQSLSPSQIGFHLMCAGGLAVAGAVLLTAIASLVPWGPTPYGGNWAALMLISYGLIASLGSVLIVYSKPNSDPRISWMMPAGQAVLLLGTIRLCQSSPMLEQVMYDLRPLRAWGVGTACLAVVWGLAAAAVRTTDRSGLSQRDNIQWLCAAALAAAVISLPAVWNWPEHFELAAKLGWSVPLTFLCVFVAWRHVALRELALLSLCGWLSTLLYFMGHQSGWWTRLELPSTGAAFALLIVATVFLWESVVENLRRRIQAARELQLRSPELSALVQPDAGRGAQVIDWPSAGPYWAASALLILCWLLGWVTLTPVALASLKVSLGASLITGEESISRLTGAASLALLCMGTAVTAVAWWLGCARRQWWLVNTGTLLPVWTALIAAGFGPHPFALTTALWVLSAWILASELLALRADAAGLSATAWRQLTTQNITSPPDQLWLPLGRALAVSLLLLGTALFISVAYVGRLPSELAYDDSLSWLRNTWLMLMTLGPALSVMLARWSISVVAGESARMIFVSGSLTAVLAGCVGSLGLPATWPSSAIVFLQVGGLLAALLAWATISFATLRNLVGLQRMLGGQAVRMQLLPKAMKGKRWKESEQASWGLLSCAMTAVAMLSLGAGVVSITYPITVLPGLQRLGGTLSLLSLVVTLTLFYLQSAQRGASRFGLLAIVLGLAAPLISAAYGSWLLANPSYGWAAAQGFEPFRLLVALWLTTLGIGLTVRIVAAQQGRSISSPGERFWLGLAAVVTGLGLVSTTHDPNPLWPLAELSVLGLIGALSGLAAGQAWRGHLAAVAAAAGLCSWILELSGSRWFDGLWLLMWGPTWVAFVSLLVVLLNPRFFANQVNAAIPQDTSGRITYRKSVPVPYVSVEQSVSLLVPITSAIFSFVWIAAQPATVRAPSQMTWWILALSVSVLVLACGRLWDARPGKRGLSVYLGLLSLSLVSAVSLCSLGQLPRLETWLVWIASGLGAMAVMAALLRELVHESKRLGPALRLSGIMKDTSKMRHALTWMPPLHCAAALLAIVPSVLLVLAFQERALRIASTAIPFLGAIAILPIAIERGRFAYRYCGLLLISLTVLLLAWADLPSAWALAAKEESWIYLQRAFAALIAMGVVYPAIAMRHKGRPEWEAPFMHCGWIAFGLGIGSGIVMLLLQLGSGWETQAAGATLATKLTTIAAWIAVVARLLQFAVWPRSTDRAATMTLRQASVYAAQIGLALLCAAFYFHFPDLFSGALARWWPVIMFAIAMASAILGQWLQRLGQTVVSDPVKQSSLLLPLIPLAGVWWIAPEGAEWLWREWSRYWLLLLTAAGLYAVHGWMRRSVALRAASAGLALLAFWAFLHSQPNLRFLEHPQFWILPPALATLLFVELNRSRLEASAVSATRYVAMLIAYFSSTAEVFLKAFEGQLWQPLLLLILALSGVAAGIALRVRAFLYCGAAFTFVSLLGMVWHAQQAIGQVWPWWAFGICTGVGLIFLLGYFEKNRQRVLVYVEQLKRWEQ